MNINMSKPPEIGGQEDIQNAKQPIFSAGTLPKTNQSYHRFSKTNRWFIKITVLLLIPFILQGMVFLFIDSISVAFFGPLLLLGLFLHLAGFLLPAVPLVWVTWWLFERLFVPRRQYGLAVIWAAASATLGSVIFYGLYTWPSGVAIREALDNNNYLTFFEGMGLVVCSFLAPTIGFIVLIRRSKHHRQGIKAP